MQSQADCNSRLSWAVGERSKVGRILGVQNAVIEYRITTVDTKVMVQPFDVL